MLTIVVTIACLIMTVTNMVYIFHTRHKNDFIQKLTAYGFSEEKVLRAIEDHLVSVIVRYDIRMDRLLEDV